ncbi:GTP 3',8-cyclase MoaA [Desulfoplanes formicivorans]|uniref:GTP 3',8-cyclase n=1 Tax=Desulfoplanes formicivorans TaxID=1592317 RepID=A0A194AGK1_9BACT|nr:GTP 3',8-cyclase MoaA [Desulfoplanes formicivorans]GAU09202.1 molybdenum cofactor biosynthesis protein MoeA [Desulfoplanes formicivorans]
MLQDHFGRKVTYVRMSITDRCNLRCLYCRSVQDWDFIPHEGIMRYEEMDYLINILWHEGVRKVRFTGGEPFARRDFIPFLEKLAGTYPDLAIHVTTNGTLIKNKIHLLRNLGLAGLNISLDTLRRDRFKQITGRDFYADVRKTIDESLSAGLRTKINVVALRGVNDDELEDFVTFAREHPLDLRFIEFMPIGGTCPWDKEHYWSARDIRDALKKLTPLVPVPGHEATQGPARMFALPEGLGRIGIISAMSDHFCEDCNRLRVTSDGRIRPCLFSDKEYPVLPLLRKDERNKEEIVRFLHDVTLKKPMGYMLLQALEARQGVHVCSRMMSTIGG